MVDNPIIDRLKIFTELDECAKRRRGFEDGDSVIVPEQIATKIELLMTKLDSLQDHEIMAELEILDVTTDFFETQKDLEEARLLSHPYWAKRSNRRKDD